MVAKLGAARQTSRKLRIPAWPLSAAFDIREHSVPECPICRQSYDGRFQVFVPPHNEAFDTVACARRAAEVWGWDKTPPRFQSSLPMIESVHARSETQVATVARLAESRRTRGVRPRPGPGGARDRRRTPCSGNGGFDLPMGPTRRDHAFFADRRGRSDHTADHPDPTADHPPTTCGDSARRCRLALDSTGRARPTGCARSTGRVSGETHRLHPRHCVRREWRDGPRARSIGPRALDLARSLTWFRRLARRNRRRALRRLRRSPRNLPAHRRRHRHRSPAPARPANPPVPAAEPTLSGAGAITPAGNPLASPASISVASALLRRRPSRRPRPNRRQPGLRPSHRRRRLSLRNRFPRALARGVGTRITTTPARRGRARTGTETGTRRVARTERATIMAADVPG